MMTIDGLTVELMHIAAPVSNEGNMFTGLYTIMVIPKWRIWHRLHSTLSKYHQLLIDNQLNYQMDS
jgi:hypothetical protein